MAKPNSLYWLTMITGDFWSWKTFWLGAELYDLKSSNPDVCLIANVPWWITDIYYNSVEDFKKLIDYLYRFYAETNNDTKKYDKHWKDIVLVMDEAQIYFPARWFADKDKKELWEKLIIVLTQCRKRYTKFWFATQRTKMVDLNFRRLADYIWYFSIMENALFKVSKLNIYQCGGGVSDLLGDDWVTWENEDQLEDSNVYHGYWKHNTTLMDSMLKIRHPFWWLWEEKHVTKHISWLFWNFFEMSYDEFKHKLYLTVHDEPAIEILNQDHLPIFQWRHKIVDNYWEIVEINKDFDFWLKNIDLFVNNDKNETDY